MTMRLIPITAITGHDDAKNEPVFSTFHINADHVEHVSEVPENPAGVQSLIVMASGRSYQARESAADLAEEG
jgi:uncharacterized protein YlzI (FlbEa/FlbD family)